MPETPHRVVQALHSDHGLTWQSTFSVEEHGTVSVNSGHAAPPQDEGDTTVLVRCRDPSCPHMSALHELQGDQELTLQATGEHRRRRRRRLQASVC